jgi:CIC family chloride channel protein
MVAAVALVAKLVATLATVSSGGSAGLLIPSIFFGAMVAAGMAPLVDIPAALLIVPAMTASLGAVVNVPLAAVFFVVEAFGSPFLIPSLVVLLVAMLLVHDNSIYRTQRETYEGRQILPGYSVRRFPVPLGWEGKTLVDLRVRNRFDVNVIGVIEAYVEDGRMRYQARFNPSIGRPLGGGDTLIVLGEDAKLDSFAATIAQENRASAP